MNGWLSVLHVCVCVNWNWIWFFPYFCTYILMKYFCVSLIFNGFQYIHREDWTKVFKFFENKKLLCWSYHCSIGFGHVENEEIATFGSFPIDSSNIFCRIEERKKHLIIIDCLSSPESETLEWKTACFFIHINRLSFLTIYNH